METETEWRGECCTDCLMLIANGDTTGNSRCETEAGEAAYLADMARRTAGYWLTIDYRGDDDGGQSPDAGFSMSSCDVCGSNLGGDRFYVVGLPASTN